MVIYLAIKMTFLPPYPFKKKGFGGCRKPCRFENFKILNMSFWCRFWVKIMSAGKLGVGHTDHQQEEKSPRLSLDSLDREKRPVFRSWRGSSVDWIQPSTARRHPKTMAEYLASIFGTEKDKVNCSFYFKIGACRHGDRCSRIHNKPSFSQTIVLQVILWITLLRISLILFRNSKSM